MQANYLADQLCEISTALDHETVKTYGDLPESSVATLLLLRRCAVPSLTFLSNEIGLSHFVTVRVIEQLEDSKLVRRLKRQGRQVQVKLTAGGKRKADELAKARRQAAETLLAKLDEEQRTVLSRAFTQILNRTDRLGSFEDLASLTAGRS
ncbi:MarR family winged helix-turn-helix transcriptional regulator [Pseudovibrio ascidiaceicola]|uniref:MarR family winged helix-turn-helix transcriptional regulator n=1 Tax=Pseudovibrio ascidiaceicola TaxID=285279 RepID=UPI003D3670D3